MWQHTALPPACDPTSIPACSPPLPQISKEEYAAAREELRAIDARPLKKVRSGVVWVCAGLCASVPFAAHACCAGCPAAGPCKALLCCRPRPYSNSPPSSHRPTPYPSGG